MLKNHNKKFKKTLVILSAFLAALSLSGCGGDAYRNYQQPGNAGGPQQPTPPTGGDPIPGAPTSPDFLPSVRLDSDPDNEPYVTGPSGTKPVFTSEPVTTDNKLRIRITALPSDNLSLSDGAYSNMNAAYSCIKFKVTALGKPVTTEWLSPSGGGANCPGAKSDQIIDFSDFLSSGHGAVTITVQAVSYDFYCQIWAGCQMVIANPYSYPYYQYQTCSNSFAPQYKGAYCPGRSVYKNHTVPFSLEAEVNNTSL